MFLFFKYFNNNGHGRRKFSHQPLKTDEFFKLNKKHGETLKVTSLLALVCFLKVCLHMHNKASL